MREPINFAMKQYRVEEEEIIRALRYARGENRAELERNLLYVKMRMDELQQSRSDISRMQNKRRLERARKKKSTKRALLKKATKDRTPKLTKLKRDEFKKGG
jgi:hypothetical protein